MKSQVREKLRSSDRNRLLIQRSVAMVLLAAFALPAYARHKPDSWARSEFAKAAAMQEALGGRPVAERSRREYEHTIEAYRRVYFGAPTSSKAEPSVVASAELMVEMGRRFNDPKALHSAIAQYEFLRREYPGSKRRFEALFTIGEIYKDDLGDQAKARSTFEDFLKRYPRNHLADKARLALADPAPPADTLAKHDKKSDGDKIAKGGTTELNDSESQPRKKKAADQTEKDNQSGKNVSPTTDDDATASQDASTDNPSQETKPSRITGIRHWSTPDYTRIAIDLEQDAKFNSQRLSSPERIFFDLKNTRLASTLVGKDLDVNDGLLRKIRVSQYQPKLSRIVLEVGEKSTYHAFLLTNPPRLMIDIHGEGPARNDTSTQTSDDSSGANISISKESAPSSVADEKSKDSNENIAPARAAKSAGIKRTTTAAGVKKTVVDADDSDDRADVISPKESISVRTKPAIQDIPRDEIASANPPEIADSTPAKTHSTKNKAKPTPDFDIHESDPRSDGDRSLIRALGLKIGKIVIDPGHGGHDAGTIGPNGLEEKDVVLDVSRRLGKLLETRLGSEVVYTRKDDTFIPLETRTAVANQEKADLFVSVHANSSHDPDARGVETYYLNFTSSSEALEVAARENAVSEKSIHELQDLVKKIALREKIEESHEFASDVESALHSGLSAKNPGLRNRGVKKAPFIVLIGANMPSILAEISFVSNPGDERRLRNADYRQKIAESLYRGIAKYVSGLNGVKVASRMEKEQPADQ